MRGLKKGKMSLLGQKIIENDTYVRKFFVFKNNTENDSSVFVIVTSVQKILLFRTDQIKKI